MTFSNGNELSVSTRRALFRFVVVSLHAVYYQRIFLKKCERFAFDFFPRSGPAAKFVMVSNGKSLATKTLTIMCLFVVEVRRIKSLQRNTKKIDEREVKKKATLVCAIATTTKTRTEPGRPGAGGRGRTR